MSKIDMEKISAGDTVIFVDEVANTRTLTDVIACFKHPDIANDRYNALHKFCYVLFLQGMDCYCPYYLDRNGRSETDCEYIEELLRNN